MSGGNKFVIVHLCQQVQIQLLENQSPTLHTPKTVEH
jgi:hypothetical protein